MNVTYNVTNTEIDMVIMKNRTMKQIHDLLGVDMEYLPFIQMCIRDRNYTGSSGG